ncbi:MAG: DUF4832 domain-containing protein [Niabella sp.]
MKTIRNTCLEQAWMHVAVICLLIPLLAFSCKKTPGSNNNDGRKETKYTESQEVIFNPERGFMSLFTVPAEGPALSRAALQTLKDEKVSIIHRNYYLEKFKDKPLSQQQLDLFQTDFNLLREMGMKVILCYAYTGIDYVWVEDAISEGKDVTDAPLHIVQQHLDQLRPVLQANKDVIAFVQAGFVGAWGEFHSSTNNLTTPENARAVINKMMEAFPNEIMIQMRTPALKRMVFETGVPISETQAYSGQGTARVGHYNHCFLTGVDDYGTYTDPVVDKDYISREAAFVPTGGETCPPTEGTPSCQKAIDEMKLLKWTYLNLNWYKPTIDAWRNAGCFTEFQRRLGYRLTLASVLAPAEVTTGGTFNIRINLKNTGYAPVYNPKKTSLVLKSTAGGTEHYFPLDADIRACKPLVPLDIEKNISLTGVAAGTYDLYLKIADNADPLRDRPEYSIRLASSGVEYTNNGLNKLNIQLKVK